MLKVEATMKLQRFGAVFGVLHEASLKNPWQTAKLQTIGKGGMMSSDDHDGMFSNLRSSSDYRLNLCLWTWEYLDHLRQGGNPIKWMKEKGFDLKTQDFIVSLAKIALSAEIQQEKEGNSAD
jgi:hypothetical protein